MSVAASVMSDVEYARMRDAEDRHWWYRSLRALARRALPRRVAGRSLRVLDAGCGTGGGFSHWAAAAGAPAYGIDLSPTALRFARDRGDGVVARARVEALPFRDASFDAVVSLDVLCLEGVDAERSLAEMRRVLRPGGTLVLNLPAFESLRGEHDVAVHIGHRFRASELAALLRGAGLVPLRSGYWNMLLCPLIWIVRHARRSRDGARSDVSVLPAPLDLALAAIVGAELRLMRARAPFGTSLFAVSRREGDRMWA